MAKKKNRTTPLDGYRKEVYLHHKDLSTPDLQVRQGLLAQQAERNLAELGTAQGRVKELKEQERKLVDQFSIISAILETRR
jgi:hypothetical protein